MKNRFRNKEGRRQRILRAIARNNGFAAKNEKNKTLIESVYLPKAAELQRALHRTVKREPVPSTAQQRAEAHVEALAATVA